MSQIINKGVFCISPVVGLNYQTLTQSGTTNENGEFLYITGETVTFSIGDLVLGSAPGAPEITPADLSFEVAGNIKRITNRKVTNIARLLLSLNPSDDIEKRITITDTIRSLVDSYRYKINLNQPEDFFTFDENVKALIAQLGTMLCSPACARNHLRRRMNGIIRSSDVKVPMRDGGYVLADVFRPAKEGKYPVIMSFGGYGKAFWLGKIANEEEFEKHEQLEDNYFEGIRAETDYINFHIMLAGGEPVPSGAPSFPQHGSPANPMLTHVSEFFERPNTVDWVPNGYIVINVDSRGLGRTPGLHTQFGRPEAEDYYDTIEWAGMQPWSNGNVGILGGSFYAINAFNVASLQPPSLKAMIPLAGDLDPYRDYAYCGGFLNKFGFVPKHCVGEWHGVDMVQHTKDHPFDDPYVYNNTAAVAMRPNAEDIKVPFWTALPLEQASIHTRGTSEAFIHTATAPEHKKIDVVSEVGVHFWMYGKEVLEKHRSFFDYWLKGIHNGIMEKPPVHIMIRTGNGGYYWQDEQEWPIARTDYQKWYLGAISANGADKHTLSKAVPTKEGCVCYSADVALGKEPDSNFGTTFISAPLTEDIVLAGYSKLGLFVSSTSHDMAILAYIRVLDENDVMVPVVLDLDTRTPVAKGALKVSHRKQDMNKRTEYRPYHTHLEKDYQPLKPNEIVEVEVEFLPTTMHIKKGWKIMLVIQPNNSGELIDLNDDYRSGSSNSIYTGALCPSYIQLPVIPIR